MAIQVQKFSLRAFRTSVLYMLRWARLCASTARSASSEFGLEYFLLTIYFSKLAIRILSLFKAVTPDETSIILFLHATLEI